LPAERTTNPDLPLSHITDTRAGYPSTRVAVAGLQWAQLRLPKLRQAKPHPHARAHLVPLSHTSLGATYARTLLGGLAKTHTSTKSRIT
jgi:hypothetical protein